MKIVPIGMKAANEYVAAHHRHHKPVRGCKFCVSVEDENGKCSVAVVRPFEEIVRMPFDVAHISKDLNDLADFILLNR